MEKCRGHHAAVEDFNGDVLERHVLEGEVVHRALLENLLAHGCDVFSGYLAQNLAILAHLAFAVRRFPTGREGAAARAPRSRFSGYEVQDGRNNKCAKCAYTSARHAQSLSR
jgi:hypothetical protein